MFTIVWLIAKVVIVVFVYDEFVIFKPLEMPMVVVLREAIIRSGSTTIIPLAPNKFVPLTMST